MSVNLHLIRHGETAWTLSGRHTARTDLPLTDGNVALFTHGHFGRVLGVRWIGLPLLEARHFLLSTASRSVLSHEHDRRDHPVVGLWNDVSHLSPVAEAPPCRER